MSNTNRDIWVVSDTHFNHSNILKYCSRPFDNVEEMNEKMVDNWNSVVKDGDVVYHLGDVYMGKGYSSGYTETLLRRLKGRKRLILGNHDNGKDQVLQSVFQKIYMWGMFPEFKCLLTHVPVHEDTLNSDKCPLNIHGHIHERSLNDPRYKCVSVEHINYTPINIEEITK